MSPIDLPSEEALRDAKRRALLVSIERLEKQLHTTHNRPLSFEAIRDEFGDVAAIIFRGRNLRKVDLRREDLSFIDFRGSDLSGCDFAGASIRGARFEFTKVSREALRLANDWSDFCTRWQPIAIDREGRRLDPVCFTRRAAERFSLSPHLPELVLLDPTIAASCEGLTEVERDFLATNRMAIALQPVTNAEFAMAVGIGGEQRGDNGRNPRERFSVVAYLKGVNSRLEDFGLPEGTRVCLPSPALLFGLASASAGLAVEPGFNLRTDIALADFQIGRKGPEFIEIAGLGGQIGEIGRVEASEPDWRPAMALSIVDRHALLRPVFFLGR